MLRNLIIKNDSFIRWKKVTTLWKTRKLLMDEYSMTNMVVIGVWLVGGLCDAPVQYAVRDGKWKVSRGHTKMKKHKTVILKIFMLCSEQISERLQQCFDSHRTRTAPVRAGARCGARCGAGCCARCWTIKKPVLGAVLGATKVESRNTDLEALFQALLQESFERSSSKFTF